MIYVTSDLHGYPLDQFRQLLAKADFCDEDFLFILGDVIDRNGDGGIEMLLWLMEQSNIQMILGNHEAMLLACRFLFTEITDDSLDSLTSEQLGLLMNWSYNGSAPTIKSLSLLHKTDPDKVDDLLFFLEDLPLYETASIDGRDFLLVHGGLDGFDPKKPISAYSTHDLVWHRPKPDQDFFDDITTIIGHTPTDYYGTPERAFHARTWIDIDTGAAHGGSPMLLRLDDMKEFYL